MEIYFNHLSSCNLIKDWSEADQAMADTPENFRDENYQLAIIEIENKKKTCNCGMQDCLSKIKELNKIKDFSIKEIKLFIIKQKIESYGKNIKRISKELKIGKSTIYRILKNNK